MTLKELETQLLALDPVEKVAAIQLLIQNLADGSHGITKTPQVMGGNAYVAHTRLPVWLFVSLRQQGATDAELLNTYPQLTAADLINVWTYAQVYPDEIAAALQAQAAAMQDDAG